VLRNLGVALAHALVAYSALARGLEKIHRIRPPAGRRGCGVGSACGGGADGDARCGRANGYDRLKDLLAGAPSTPQVLPHLLTHCRSRRPTKRGSWHCRHPTTSDSPRGLHSRCKRLQSANCAAFSADGAAIVAQKRDPIGDLVFNAFLRSWSLRVRRRSRQALDLECSRGRIGLDRRSGAAGKCSLCARIGLWRRLRVGRAAWHRIAHRLHDAHRSSPGGKPRRGGSTTSHVDLTPDLEPDLYDQTAFLEIVKHFVLRAASPRCACCWSSRHG